MGTVLTKIAVQTVSDCASYIFGQFNDIHRRHLFTELKMCEAVLYTKWSFGVHTHSVHQLSSYVLIFVIAFDNNLKSR